MGFKIEYEVKLNDEGRPYIEIGDEFNDHPEHRFFVIEITRYILYDLIDKNRKRGQNSRVSEQSMHILENTAESIHNISDEMAKLIKGHMDHSIDLDDFINFTNYDITVDSQDDLERIQNGAFVFNDKIYTKKHGLRVRVIEDMCVYELKENQDGEFWENITPNRKHEDEDSENEA